MFYKKYYHKKNFQNLISISNDSIKPQNQNTSTDKNNLDINNTAKFLKIISFQNNSSILKPHVSIIDNNKFSLTNILNKSDNKYEFNAITNNDESMTSLHKLKNKEDNNDYIYENYKNVLNDKKCKSSRSLKLSFKEGVQKMNPKN